MHHGSFGIHEFDLLVCGDAGAVRRATIGTGRTGVGGEPARQHIDELSLRYNGHEYTNPIGPQGRVILTIAADKVNTPRRIGRR